MKLETPADYLKVGVAIILVAICFSMLRGMIEFLQDYYGNSESGSSATSSDEWITYTNTDYGYAISYPSHLKLVKSSEFAAPSLASGKKDQAILIGDPVNQSIYDITAGYLNEFSAYNNEEIKNKYISQIVPQLISGKAAEGRELKPEDFFITENTVNDEKVILVNSPIHFSIIRHNSNGEVFITNARDYTGATTTPKEQLTREIMETFRVID